MASGKTLVFVVYSGIAILAATVVSLSLLLPYLPSSQTFDLYHLRSANNKDQKPQNDNLYPFHTIPELENMSLEGDAAWQDMTTTRGGGFLWIRHNETYRVGWGVSMFHALHCLSMIREIVKQNPHFDSETGGSEHGSGHEHDAHMDYKHAGHCLSYIAQSLMCSADGTLEKPRSLLDANGDILRDDVNGEDVKHTCKDKSLMLDMIHKSEKQPLDYYPDTKEGDTIWDVFE